MSVDVTEETYYLTPQGWTTRKPDPVAIIEAWDLDIYWALGWGEEHHHWTCMWVTDNPAWTLQKRNALRAAHPFPDTSEGRVAASVGWPLVESRSSARMVSGAA